MILYIQLLSPRSSNFIARAVKFNEADNEKYENFCTQIEEFAIVGRVFWNTFHLLARFEILHFRLKFSLKKKKKLYEFFRTPAVIF